MGETYAARTSPSLVTFNRPACIFVFQSYYMIDCQQPMNKPTIHPASMALHGFLCLLYQGLGRSHQLASGQEKHYCAGCPSTGFKCDRSGQVWGPQQLGCRQGPAPTLTRTHKPPFQSAGRVGRGTGASLSCCTRALCCFASSVRGAGCTEAVCCMLLCGSCRMRSRLHA